MSRVLAAGLAVALAATPAAAQQGPIPREHAQTVAAFGGLQEGPAAGYLAGVGERVAAAAGRPGQCSFHLLNSEVVNAFTAPPGCHIYVTRGLLALVNGEAEVAAVIGHELGHVTANHAGRRQQRSALTGIGAALLGAVTGSDLIGQIAGQAGQLYVLSYSRSQEFESDDLSVRYLAGSGRYPTEGLVGLLAALQRQDQFDAQLSGGKSEAQPSWARSHPLTGERIARAAQKARAAEAGAPAPVVDETAFLAAIDGLAFGEDPSQGLVDGRSFVHPGLGVSFTAPQGFQLANGERAVTLRGPDGVQGQFAMGRLQGGLDEYAHAVLRELVGRAPVQPGQPQRTRINGLDAVILPAQARAQSGLVDVTVAAYAAGGGAAYHFVTLSPPGRGQAATEALIASLRRLPPAEAAALAGRRIQVVTVRPGDTAASLAERMAFADRRLERFALLNDLDPADPLTPGRRVKLVTRGAPPTSRPPNRPGGH